MYVSSCRAYMLTTSKDDIFRSNLDFYIKSSLLSVTVPSVPPVCAPTTSVRNNVICNSITCCDTVITCPRKSLCKITIVKNRNVVNYVSEPINNVVNCSRSTSMSSSIFIRQPVRFNKFVHKHVSSNFVNKLIPSVNVSETFCTMFKNVKTDLMIYGYKF